jgi:hypothetical protein
LADVLDGEVTSGSDAVLRRVAASNIAAGSTVTIADEWPGMVREDAAANSTSSAVQRASARSTELSKLRKCRTAAGANACPALRWAISAGRRSRTRARRRRVNV